MLRLLVTALFLAPTAALAHPGHGGGFAAGLTHPVLGPDHVAAMLAVGVWAGLTGGRALWAWPAAFVGGTALGAAIGLAGVTLPWTEAGIVASLVALGALIAFRAHVHLLAGVMLLGIFALFHGYAHGTENAGGAWDYVAGLITATAVLHAAGIAAVVGLRSLRLERIVPLAGAACMALGAVLAFQAV